MYVVEENMIAQFLSFDIPGVMVRNAETHSITFAMLHIGTYN